MSRSLDAFFEPFRDYAQPVLRLLIGTRLIYGTQDNIISWERMLEFGQFLAAHHVPYSLIAAIISVYLQFICGCLYIIGAYVRWAAVVMILNFVAALIIAHTGTSFLESYQALTMLFGSVCLLIAGAGKASVDALRVRLRTEI